MLEIKNKIEFENNLWVGEVDASLANSSREERIKFVTNIASICLGRLGFDDNKVINKTSCNDRDAKGNLIVREEQLDYNNKIHSDLIKGSRLRLYNKLLTEAAGKASMPLRFVPVICYADMKSFDDINLLGYSFSIDQIMNIITKFGYVEIDNPDSGYNILKIYTNMQALLNAYIPEEAIPFNSSDELKNYKCIIGKLPKIVFDHLVTHGQLARIAESSRNKKYLNEVEFHYPNVWIESFTEFKKQEDSGYLIEQQNLVKTEKVLKAEDATKELSCRRLILSAWAGWMQNKNTWDNLFLQRSVSHTQNITKIVVENIKQLIK